MGRVEVSMGTEVDGVFGIGVGVVARWMAVKGQSSVVSMMIRLGSSRQTTHTLKSASDDHEFQV